jgi:predicted PurR-regulated permease PerM
MDALPAGPSPEQSRILWRAVTALAVTSLIGIAGLLFYGFITFLSWAYPVLLPIGLAVILALFLEPVVDFISHHHVKRRTATLLTCLLAMVAFVLFWVFILPPVVDQGGKFINSLPGWINAGVDKLQTLGSEPAEGAPSAAPEARGAGPTPAPAPTPILVAPKRPLAVDSEIHAWVSRNLPVVEQSIQNTTAHLVYTAMGPVGQALGFMLGFGFVPIYVYYFLADKERISAHWRDYVPLRRSPLRNEVISVVSEINQVLVKYFRGQIVVAGCNGLLTFLGLWAIGIPYSLILGIITGALSIVPFLGIIASILPALLLGFISSQGWIRPVLVLLVFALVQMSESMFITPRVQSHSTGLHPLTIIIGILFWSMLLPGLLGPVVAVPLTCAVVVLLRRYVWQSSEAESLSEHPSS